MGGSRTAPTRGGYWGGGEGWVPAYARTREGRGMGPRIREDTGRERDGSPHTRGHGKGEGWVPAYARTREGRGMGPRIREDTGRERDGSPHTRGHGKGEGWVPAYARTREGRGMGPRIRARERDGSPHARGQGRERVLGNGRLVVGVGSSPPSKPSPVEGEGWGEGGGVCWWGDSAKLP